MKRVCLVMHFVEIPLRSLQVGAIKPSERDRNVVKRPPGPAGGMRPWDRTSPSGCHVGHGTKRSTAATNHQT